MPTEAEMIEIENSASHRYTNTQTHATTLTQQWALINQGAEL